MATPKEDKVKNKKNYAQCKAIDKYCMNPYCFYEGATLEAHHIIARGLGGDDDLSNLITLCHKCHRDIEDGHLDIIKNVLNFWIGKDNFRWQKSLDKLLAKEWRKRV